MTSSLEIALVPIVILVVAVVLLSIAGRRRQLKCPDCGTVFAAPAMDVKRSGLGWTLPFMGNVKCPKCGQSRSRRDYQKAPAAPKTAT